MSRKPNSASPKSPSTQPGPSLLAERSLLGIFVHVIGLLSGFVGPCFVYWVSDHEFTRANARNALNWQLFLTPAFLVATAVVAVPMGVSNWFEIPDVIEFVLFVPVAVVVVALTLLSLMAFVLPIVATVKAIFGKTWEYPIAPDFVSRVGGLT
ncbi:DUF4870 domain-containing protein [Halorussus aquaticus]|uniref:DUF4870 domain-containing protein n=1 Tax=Halorussus aquaticus TaxID=2953748 RepID=A0ABD5Q088_9EURY|nr:DUF4870 domain-containing protein [Halorussus aquaticus]